MGEILDGVKRIQEASARSEELLAALVQSIIDGGGGGADIAAAIARHNADTAAHAALVGVKIRRLLTGGITLYVAPSGNDANDGLAMSPDRALQTANGLVNTLRSIDQNGHDLHVIIRSGVNYGTLDLTTVHCNGMVYLHGENAADFPVFDMILIGAHNRASVNNIEILKRLTAQHGSILAINNIQIGAGVSNYADRCIYSISGSNVTFRGGQVNIYGQPAAVFFVSEGGFLRSGWRPANQPVTEFIFHDVQVAEGVFNVSLGSTVELLPEYTSMTGSAIGKKFAVGANSIITTTFAGPDFIPGTVAGNIEAASGGIYA